MSQSNQPSAFNYVVNDRPTNVQEFSISGRWVKPPNANLVQVELWSGGGGGGSGRRDAAATNRNGGTGGGGGALVKFTLKASDLTSIVAVTIGAGGAGGAAQTVNTTDGNAGTTGGNITSVKKNSVVLSKIL